MIQLKHFYPLTEQLAFIPICVFAIAITRPKRELAWLGEALEWDVVRSSAVLGCAKLRHPLVANHSQRLG